jgi:hypothetical protein
MSAFVNRSVTSLFGPARGIEIFPNHQPLTLLTGKSSDVSSITSRR